MSTSLHSCLLRTSADDVEAGSMVFSRLSFVVLVLPLLFMAGVFAQPWIDPAELLRDPLAVAELNLQVCCKVYYGAVSNLGVLIWMAGAAITLFASALALSLRQPSDVVLFMFAAGLLTGLLAVDDLYLVHENVLPALGVPELVGYGGYGVLGILYLVLSWRQILQHNYLIFSTAVILLATSVLIDHWFHSDHPVRIVLEDGAKFIGICAWIGFHITAAWSVLNGAAQRSTGHDVGRSGV